MSPTLVLAKTPALGGLWNMGIEHNGLQEIIDNALQAMGIDRANPSECDKVNLAEFSRLTGITRSKARTLQSKGFTAGPHGRTGMRREGTVLTGHTDVLDDLLRSGITNSSVCLDRLIEHGYAGGLTQVKVYIKAHADLVPAKRRSVKPQGNRGRRYRTEPGEAYQMDWGFVNVEDWTGSTYRIACFAMVCHHCGTCYVEFFPNARPENLFIGMIRAFLILGVPSWVLTDNMKSVVVGRNFEGSPVWQKDYEQFMRCIGFKTRLCKPYHPYTKGKVERLIRYVKDNFLAGRRFNNVSELNASALEWCARQSSRYRRALACVPADEHASCCMQAARTLERTEEVAAYLCPRRRISFDGFVNYEGRRFGVPYWYPGKECRVSREGEILHIYAADLSRELVAHPVTWSRKDAMCKDQYDDAMPLELPSAPVTCTVKQEMPRPEESALSRFDFERRMA